MGLNVSSNNKGAANSTTMVNADVVLPFLTNSFEERMRVISIQEGTATTMDDVVVDEEAPSSPPPLPRRIRTFDHDILLPPLLNIDLNMTYEDNAGVDDYYNYNQDTDERDEDVMDHVGMVLHDSLKVDDSAVVDIGRTEPL